MTTTTAPAVKLSEQPIVPPPPRRKRRPIWVALAVVLVALGALLAWYVVANLRDTESVVALRTDVPRGAIIEVDDLTTAEIMPDPALITVPASDLSAVVGRRAAVDLHAGGLLSPASIADTIIPEPGHSVVGLALEAGQLPATTLKVGDHVRIISTPRDQDEAPTENPVVTIQAVVVSSTSPADSARTWVDVSVTTADAPHLAGLVATNRVALILDNSE